MSESYKGTSTSQAGANYTEGSGAQPVTAEKRDGTTKTVQSDLSDAQAIAKLAVQSVDGGSDFASDLLVKHNQYGLSVKQWVWVHILACEKDQRAERQASLPRTQNVLDYMTTAAQNLKYPKVLLVAEDGSELKLSVAGQKAKMPGSVNLTDGGPFGENVWYGRINTDGRCDLRDDAPEAIVNLVHNLDADPVAVVGECGKKSGACCCCGKELTHDHSLAVGYGPTCAKNFGMPWGSQAAQAVTQEQEPDAPGVERTHEDDAEVTDTIKLSGEMTSIDLNDDADDEDVPF